MIFFRNMSIRTKLLSGYSFILLLSAFIGSTIILSIVNNTIKSNIDDHLNNSNNMILNMVKTTTTTSIRSHLRAISEKNIDILWYFYNQYKQGFLSEIEAKKRAESVLLSQKIGKTGYIYCTDSNGIIQVHPKKEVLSQDLSEHGFIKKQIEKKLGYLEYDWANPGELDTRPKALYMDHFEAWDWIISVSSYRSEFKELIQVDDFKASILSVSLGKSGYLYIIDSKGNVVIHPKYETNTNFFNTTDTKGRKFIQEMCQKKSGKIAYTWKNPDEQSYQEKLVVFNSIDELDWIVVSSIYLDEFYEPIRTIFYIIGLTMVVAFIFIFTLTWWISSAIIRPLNELMLQFDIGAKGYFSGHVVVRSDDEIGRLAGYYNTFMAKFQEYNDRLILAKNTAEAANQAKSDFLMNMSHELKTPLNGVIAASELITMTSSDAELEEIQGIIELSGNSLLRTVEQILDFTKSKDGEFKLSSNPFRLNDVLSKIKTRFLHKGTQLDLKLKIDFEPDNVPNALIGDEIQLIEILNNILENAAKFTENTPEATLRIKTLKKSPEEVLFEFSLSDNGIGISKEHFEMIFEAFSQVDTSTTRNYDGVGIGLSTCKQLVELMGGKIWVESELGMGSTFYLTLNLKRQRSNEFLNIQIL